MHSAPKCSSIITFHFVADDVKSLFYFSASAVELMAKKLIAEESDSAGLIDAAKWASFRDETIDAPSEISSFFEDFDYIAEGLIEAEHGQVYCLGCNKLYMSPELAKDTYFRGSWLVADFKCSAQHTLMRRELAHFMFKRNYE